MVLFAGLYHTILKATNVGGNGSRRARPARQPGRLCLWGRWLLRISVSVALLGLVIAQTDASRVGILVAHVRWGWWVAGLALVPLALLASAQRFRLLIRGLRHDVSLGSVMSINLEAMFFNLVGPGDLLAGLVRWDRISCHTGDRTRAFTLMVAERLMDWVVVAVVAAAGAPLLFGGESAPRLRVTTAAMAGAVAVLGCAVALAGRRQSSVRAVRVWRARCGPRTEPWVGRLERLLDAGRALSSDPRRTVAGLFWTATFWCTALAGNLVMAQAVFPQMPVLPFVTASAMLALLAQLPLTFAGVGLRELSLPMLLGAYGVTDEVGLLVGLSAFVPSVLVGLVGLTVRLAGRAHLEESVPPGTERSSDRAKSTAGSVLD